MNTATTKMEDLKDLYLIFRDIAHEVFGSTFDEMNEQTKAKFVVCLIDRYMHEPDVDESHKNLIIRIFADAVFEKNKVGQYVMDTPNTQKTTSHNKPQSTKGTKYNN